MQRQAFAGQNEELGWVLVKCLRKRVGGPGLINACNISKAKSEEEDSGGKERVARLWKVVLCLLLMYS